MSKVINVRFEFEDDEWETVREFYTEREVRMSLREVALSELSCLVDARIERKQREGEQ